MLGKLYDDIFVIDMSKSYLEHLRRSGNVLIQNEHILEPEDQLEAKSQDLFRMELNAREKYSQFVMHLPFVMRNGGHSPLSSSSRLQKRYLLSFAFLPR
jgi:hypothetical protein